MGGVLSRRLHRAEGRRRRLRAARRLGASPIVSCSNLAFIAFDCYRNDLSTRQQIRISRLMDLFRLAGPYRRSEKNAWRRSTFALNSGTNWDTSSFLPLDSQSHAKPIASAKEQGDRPNDKKQEKSAQSGEVIPDHHPLIFRHATPSGGEAEWNSKLRALSEAEQNYERQREADQLKVSTVQREQVLALATNFPQLWNDPATADRERKRMVRLLIEEVTVRKAEQLQLDARFRGGCDEPIVRIDPEKTAAGQFRFVVSPST